MSNKQQACPVDRFCLGMCSWTNCSGNADCADYEPRLEPTSLSDNQLLPRSASNEPHPPESSATGQTTKRFATFLDDEELSTLSKGMTPGNTKKSTQWALSNFEDWRVSRNRAHPTNLVPENLFLLNDPSTLTLNLSRFAIETRKTNGEPYPPKTIHQLLCGLLRHMRDVQPGCPNFLDKKDSRFKKLHGALDSHFHHLHSKGIGRDTKSAQVLTEDDEDKLWTSGALGTTSPNALQNAVFFVVGTVFSLRGGVELRAFCPSQLKRQTDPDRYIYTENVSKTNNGTFKRLRVQNKVVPVYACPEVGERCPVYLLDLYFSKLPHEALTNDIFYVRPLDTAPTDASKPWYTSTAVGRNMLDKKLATICKQAGIDRHITNHCLRATSVTKMYRDGVPEKVIQERTGHRSIEGLRVYERSDIQQHQSACKSIVGDSSYKAKFNDCVTHKSTRQLAFQQSQQTTTLPSNAMQNPQFSFGSLHGCTININTGGSAPPTTVTPTITNSTTSLLMSQAELDELLSDF